MDLHEEIRFRVTNINFTRVIKTAKGELSDEAYYTVCCETDVLSLMSRHSSYDNRGDR